MLTDFTMPSTVDCVICTSMEYQGVDLIIANGGYFILYVGRYTKSKTRGGVAHLLID